MTVENKGWYKITMPITGQVNFYIEADSSKEALDRVMCGDDDYLTLDEMYCWDPENELSWLKENGKDGYAELELGSCKNNRTDLKVYFDGPVAIPRDTEGVGL